MRDRRPTLVELEALRAVLAEGTTAAAGNRLGRAQSSISRSIAELERRTGRILFERRGRMIEPTAEALALNAELDALFGVLDRLAGNPDQTGDVRKLSLAAPPAFALSLLPRALAAFHRTHPGCLVSLEVATTSDVIRLVAEGVADIGLTDSRVVTDGVRLEPFRRSQIVCLMPLNHRLAGGTSVSIGDLDGEPFVALARRHSMRAQIEGVMAQAGVRPAVAAEVSTAIAALGLIREGIGIGLLNPFPLMDGEAMRGLIALPFDEPLTYLTAFVLTRASPPTALARRFQRFLTQFVDRDRWSTSC